MKYSFVQFEIYNDFRYGFKLINLLQESDIFAKVGFVDNHTIRFCINLNLLKQRDLQYLERIIINSDILNVLYS